ncbi:MAG: iron-sulfur cluster assembly scaffold protein [Clostridia bacterium]|nr:iron-sulfur cluster assembly scaffold protein [Clostridia bacterium]
MKSTHYSDKVLDHFRHPRNTGTLKGADVAKGRVGNPVCGDLMEIYIKVRDERIEDIKFKTFGCGSAVATASMVTELAKGKSLVEASRITRQDVANELDGLPPVKMHCSNLAADALHDAINSYLNKEKRKSQSVKKVRCQKRAIIGERKFLNKGVFHKIDDLLVLKDKRVLVLDRGEKSLEIALELTKQTGRVIFVASSKDIDASVTLRAKAKQSDVKFLYQSEVLEIRGTDEVERVLIHDLDEDEEYELFVDSVIML